METIVQSSTKPLKPNPYKAYRDPHTGRWVTVIPPTLRTADVISRRPEGYIRVAETLEAFYSDSVAIAG